MTKKEIFETLANLECETFYKHSKEENAIIRQALEAYAKLTGANND